MEPLRNPLREEAPLARASPTPPPKPLPFVTSGAAPGLHARHHRARPSGWRSRATTASGTRARAQSILRRTTGPAPLPPAPGSRERIAVAAGAPYHGERNYLP